MADLDSRFRSVTLPGVASAQATATMLRVLSDGPGLRVDQVGDGRLSVSRTARPRWATIAAIALCWVGGLGLLFLLVRRTEAQEALVVDAPRGCVVTIPPLVDPALRVRLEESLVALRRQPAAVGAPAWERVGVDAPDAPAGPPDDGLDDGLDDRTVARVGDPARVEPEPVAAPPRVLLVEFADGAVEIGAGESVVLGRDPSAASAAASPERAVVVAADSATVSKSHLRVAWDGAAITVTDLHSTNGSSIDDGSGPVALEPGVAITVAPGVSLALGATIGATRTTVRSES